ncbi:MAG: hemerythrin domain-containing protein [Rhodocyclaceae bacterium]|nr:hemerythrin domain-containing protein [Rhodocyclaceae bacterium]
MKRGAALLQLSREHHGALVLAQRIAKANDAAAIDALMATLPTTFQEELEPHFQAEENGLLLRLQAAGETALVQRTVDDHRRLRRLAARVAHGDRASLEAFGIELAAHVRFEERELFARAEAVLPPNFIGTADSVFSAVQPQHQPQGAST